MKELGKVDPFKYRVKFLTLMILATKPSHGYEILKKLEEISEGFVKGGPGAIYPILKELKDEGLIKEKIVQEGGRQKKVYELTKKGAIEAIMALDTFHAIVRNLLELAGEARRAVLERVDLDDEDLCPSIEMIDILRKINNLVSQQLKKLEDLLKRCRDNKEAFTSQRLLS